MTLPQQDELDRVLAERPGDEIFPRVKPHIEQINEQEEELKSRLIPLILEDMTYDLALANALDSVGEVLEYLAQERQIEKPEFSGEMMMRNFSRLSKLKVSLDYAEMLGLQDGVLDAVLKAEVDRLWQNDSNSAMLKQLLLNKAAQTTAPAPQPAYPPMYTEKGKNG
jgi:D-ribose pyranose/furanose isomerase RbsD